MKKLTENLRQNWPTYFFEILVLIIGIYGAFALESWNEKFKQKRRSVEILKALEAEYLSNLSQRETNLKSHRLVKQTSIDLLKIINSNTRLSEDSLQKLTANIGWLFTFDPQSSALNSTISSGDIHFITNDSLIQALFQWPDMVFDVKEDEIRAKGTYTDLIIPYTFQYIMESELIDHFYEDEELIFESSFDSDYYGLVYNRTFENYIALRLENTEDILLEMIPIYESNRKILAMINQELKRHKN